MKQNPLVSVILPTYNGKEGWLQESVDSVLSQTYINFELLILDDGSTNNSPVNDVQGLISSYVQKDARVVFLKNEKNIGLIRTLNRGLEVAKGKYIARIDDDDTWCNPEKLEKQIAFMENNPDYGLCGTGYEIIDEDGVVVGKAFPLETDDAIRKRILMENIFNHCTIVFRSSLLSVLGGYRNTKKTLYCEDYDMRLRIGLEQKLYNLQIITTQYRVHTNNISKTAKARWTRNTPCIARSYRKHYPHRYINICIHFLIYFLPKSFVKKIVYLKKKLIP